MKWLRRPLTWSWLLACLPAAGWLLPTAFGQAPSFRDQGDFFYPLKLYTASRLFRGDIPLWNPLSGLGEPWLANLQSGVFYPPTAFFFLHSAALAGGLFLLLHFALGAWGIWKFLKDEAVSDSGALLGTGLYTSSGFAASISTFWNHFSSWSYVPAVAWLARSGLRSRSSRLGLALLIALQAMAGSPEISAATLALAGILLATARRPEEVVRSDTPGRRAARLVAASLLGLAIAGWALVPFAELLAQSGRRDALARAERESGTVGTAAAASVLGLSTNSSGSSYLESLYIGPIALIAAAAAFGEKERRRLVLVLAGVGIVAFLVSAAAPPGTWLRSLPPLDRVRYPAKALTLAFFALSVLAGFGLDALRFQKTWERRLPLLFLIGVLLLLTLVSPLALEAKALSAAGVVALLVLALRLGRPGRALLPILAAALLLGSHYFANRAVFRFAPEEELRREPESVHFLAAVPGRVLTAPMSDTAIWVLQKARFDAETLRRQREALLGYTNLLGSVRTVRTAAALPTRAAARIEGAIDAAPDVARASGPASARLLWTPFLPANMGSRKVGEFFRAPINPYRARISLVSGFTLQTNPDAAWSEVARGGADWRTTVLLDQAPQPAPSSGAGGAVAMVSLQEERPELLAVRAYANGNKILVVTDLHYPGWKAELDGRPVPLLKADGYLRAIALPAGEHRVVFRYRPLSVVVGGGLTLAAALAWLLLAWSGEPSPKAVL
jgi:hypothetical protein